MVCTDCLPSQLADKTQYDENLLIDEAFGLIFAGFETTGSAMATLLALLVLHPNDMKRVVAQIDEVGLPLATAKQASLLTLINAAFNETLRLHPVSETKWVFFSVC